MFASIQPEHIAVMIPIVAVLGTFAVVVVAIVVEGRKKELVHKERLFALEKGLPLPEPPEKKEKPVYATRRAWGLVWFGMGLATTVALAFNPAAADVNAWGWGLIPTFIGAGLLVAGFLDKREWDQRRLEEKPEEAGPASPGGPRERPTSFE
jgi:hypothetical protein